MALNLGDSLLRNDIELAKKLDNKLSLITDIEETIASPKLLQAKDASTPYLTFKQLNTTNDYNFKITSSTTGIIGRAIGNIELYNSKDDQDGYIFTNTGLTLKNKNIGSLSTPVSTIYTTDLQITGSITDGTNTITLNNIVSDYLPLTAGSNKILTGILHTKYDDSIWSGLSGIQLAPNAYITGSASSQIGIKSNDSIRFRIGNQNDAVIEENLLRPGVTKTINLGNVTYQWNDIYGTTIYQSGKQVANKEDLNDYTLTSTTTELSNALDQYKADVEDTYALKTSLDNYLLLEGGTLEGNLSAPSINVSGYLTSSFYKCDDTVATLKISDNNELNFGTDGNAIYFGYDYTRISNDITPVSNYYFGNGSGLNGRHSGIIYCGNLYVNNGADQVATIGVYETEEEAQAASEANPNKICIY